MDSPSATSDEKRATSSCCCGAEVGHCWGRDGDAGYCCGADAEPKPFLGGYRNASSGVLFHHACSQTPLPVQPPRSQVCSEVQTSSERSRAVQTKTNAATQCPRPGYHEDTSNDRILLPTAHHATAAQLLERKRASVVTIQRHLRGWLGRQRLSNMRRATQALDEFAAAQQAQRRQQQEEYRQAEIRRRMQPRSTADFAILHTELAGWWEQETERIKGADVEESVKQDALRQLLAKETRLLQTIDKLKIAAAPPNRAHQVEGVLQRLSAPKQWSLGNGQLVEVQTPSTLRATELAAMYRTLVAADGGNMDARLTALLQVRDACQEFEEVLTRELVQLIDREADLLSRGRNPRGMEGLRQRIASQFLGVIKGAALATASPLKRHRYRFTHRNVDYQESPRESVGIQAA